MQLLFFTYLTLATIVAMAAYPLYMRWGRVVFGQTFFRVSSLFDCVFSDSSDCLDYWTFFAILSYSLASVLIATLTNFVRVRGGDHFDVSSQFHWGLVTENFTTIENLEREEGRKSKYDVGRLGEKSSC